MFTQTWSRRNDVSLRCSNLSVRTKKINQNKPDRYSKCTQSGLFKNSLVEAEVGYVGGLDYVGVIVALFVEGDGDVLDDVGCAEFHQELDEVAEVFDEEIIADAEAVNLLTYNRV